MADLSPASGPHRIDTTVAQSARIWDYWLGGKDNYPADWEAGDRIRSLYPAIGEYARADRQFLGRAVRYLAGTAGIRQFLDIGTGLPTADNTHEVAQRVAPATRIVYVDNDPLVLTHARALLASSPEGATDYVDADLHDPDLILREAAATLDFTQPIAVMLLGVAMFIGDSDEDGEQGAVVGAPDTRPYEVVRRLMEAVPAGSYLALSHTITGPGLEHVDDAVAFWNSAGSPKLRQRTIAQVSRFFDGLDLLDPGVVACNRWSVDPADPPAGDAEEVAFHCGVARKR